MKELTTYIIHLIISIVTVYLFFEFTAIESHFLNNAILFVAAYFLLWAFSRVYDRAHFYKVPRAIGLLFYFFRELAVASLAVAWDVITPRSHVESGVIALPLDARSNIEITILASLISLTPGTLSMDVSADKRILYLHAVYIPKGDAEVLRRSIKNGFEKKLLELTRKYHG